LRPRRGRKTQNWFQNENCCLLLMQLHIKTV
jgi:hypothetical protein